MHFAKNALIRKIFYCLLQTNIHYKFISPLLFTKDDDRYHLSKNSTEKGLNKNVKYFHSSNWTTNYLIMLFWKSSFLYFYNFI